MTVDVHVFQLKRQMDEEVVFVGFTEGEIDFQPTYKYDTGSDQWDTRSENTIIHYFLWHFFYKICDPLCENPAKVFFF